MIRNLNRKNSQHFDERAEQAKPTYLIMHYTGTKTAAYADDIFMGVDTTSNPSGRVSAHYMIDMDGSTTQYVDDDLRAWHAGVGYWRGITDMNSHSIGIEIVNPGHDHGYRDFPEEQIKSVISLARQIITTYFIPAENIIAHSDIAPARKIDPGEKFPWKHLAENGVGLWPAPTKEDMEAGKKLIKDKDSMLRHLIQIGYDPAQKPKTLFAAFQRHYHPERINRWGRAKAPNAETAARLIALKRQIKSFPETVSLSHEA